MGSPNTDRDLCLAALLDQALTELRACGRIDTETLLAGHPDLADDLPRLIATLQSLDEVTDPLREPPA